jgi:hypothetical protein
VRLRRQEREALTSSSLSYEDAILQSWLEQHQAGVLGDSAASLQLSDLVCIPLPLFLAEECLQGRV